MSKEPWVAAYGVARHRRDAKEPIYRWNEGKGLPAHKVGLLWKSKVSEVCAWVRAGEARTGEQEEIDWHVSIRQSDSKGP